jgi:hypothetical protein
MWARNAVADDHVVGSAVDHGLAGLPVVRVRGEPAPVRLTSVISTVKGVGMDESCPANAGRSYRYKVHAMGVVAVTPDPGSGLPLWLFIPVALVIVGAIVWKRMR